MTDILPARLPSVFALCLLAGAMACPTAQAADDAPQAEAASDAAPRYTHQRQHDPNGIGKFYMGREIAQVMGHQGISWLERPQREEEERLSGLVDALKVEPGMVVADIGAGSGVISVMIARRLGDKGKVLAVDIQQEMLDALVEKCRLLNVTNVEPVRGTNKSPRLDPGTVDLAFMVDVYHEFDFPYEMLKGLADSLKPGGRIAFVEYRKEDPTVPIKEVHKMYEMQVRLEANLPEFGLVWKETDERLPLQHVIIFEKIDPSKNAPITLSGEWPQFRGPRSDNHADQADLPLTWSETENVLWSAEIPGLGWSSPVVCGRQVWMTTATDEGRSLRAVCVDRYTGDSLHDIEVFKPAEPCPINDKNSYASPTPIVEPGRVYVHFGTMGTAAINAITGKVLWRNETLKVEHKEGPGGSPILVDNKLVIECDGMDEQYVAVLDKMTGEVISKLPREQPFPENTDFRKAFATPLAVRIDGQVQLLCPGADQLEVHGPNGPLWNVRYHGFSNVPQPMYSPSLNMIFICTGYMKPELWAIRPGGSGNVTESHVAWKFARQVPAVSTPVVVDDRIYMIHEQGVATCVSATTGEQVWQKRVGGAFTASPLANRDRIYLFAEDGKTTVLKTGDEFTVLSEAQLPGRVQASPAVADNVLFIRTDAKLFAISASSKVNGDETE
jgi:outer membrane protein assembly factor BamB/SAM-dependent methyltransferase